MVQDVTYRGFRISIEKETEFVYCYRIYPLESGTFLDQDNSKHVRESRLAFGSTESNPFRRMVDDAMDWIDWHLERVLLFIKQAVENIENERIRDSTRRNR